MARGGYDPRAALALWGLLNEIEDEQKANGEVNWADQVPWTRTHPTGSDRQKASRRLGCERQDADGRSAGNPTGIAESDEDLQQAVVAGSGRQQGRRPHASDTHSVVTSLSTRRFEAVVLFSVAFDRTLACRRCGGGGIGRVGDPVALDPVHRAADTLLVFRPAQVLRAESCIDRIASVCTTVTPRHVS